jgi:hypothetical protein
MPKASGHAWITKLLVSLHRKRHCPQRHLTLKERLGVNRGKALGYPKPYPPTKQAQKAQDRRIARIQRKFGAPF